MMVNLQPMVDAANSEGGRRRNVNVVGVDLFSDVTAGVGARAHPKYLE